MIRLQELIEMLHFAPDANMWKCIICKQFDPTLIQGDLMCCDTCPVAAHRSCYAAMFKEEIPSDPDISWMCLSCRDDPAARTLEKTDMVCVPASLLFTHVVRVVPYVASSLLLCIVCGVHSRHDCPVFVIQYAV